MVRKMFFFTLALFLAGTALAADKVRFAIHFKLNPHYVLPVLAALEKGFWKDQALEVSYLPFDASTDMDKGVAAREVDVGMQSLPELIRAASAGILEVVVADPDIATAFNFWVRTESPLKQPKDVKGAKIGVTRFGATSHVMAQAVVKALGIEEKEVKFISMGGGAPHVAGLRAGAIDVATLSSFAMGSLLARGEVRELVRMEDYLPKGVAGQVLFARKEFLERNPAVVKKVIKGFLQGAEFVMKNPEWSIEKMKGEFRYSPEVARLAFPWVKYDTKGKVEEARVKNTVDFIIEYGILAKEKIPPLDSLYRKGFTE